MGRDVNAADFARLPNEAGRRDAITPRQRAVFDTVRELLAERGYPPTVREIGERLGIRSTNGVNDHLAALERRGYLERDWGVARGLRVLKGET